MNEDARYEQLFADALVDLAPPRAPARLKTDIKQSTSRSRPRPRWLAVIKEPPMRLSSALAVGSPTARVAAIVAATLLIAAAVAGAGIAGSRILAVDDGIIVVDQNGDGDFSTIADAVAVAQDGETVLVRPGTYVEAVVIEEDITLKGDGPREDIILTAPGDGPTVKVKDDEPTLDPYAVMLDGSDATLSGLTFHGELSEVIVSGGAPTLESLAFIDTGRAFDGSTTSAAGSSVVITEGSTATIRDNTISGGGPIGVFNGASPLIEGNSLTGGPHIWGNFGDGTVIRENSIVGTLVRAIGIFGPSGDMEIEGNTIADPGETGIDVWSGSPQIIENRVSGATRNGVFVAGSGAPLISGNTLVGNLSGISWSAGDGTIKGNAVSGGRSGIVISGGAPQVVDNVVSGLSGRGLAIGLGAEPRLSGNTSCDNAENLWLAEGATPTIDDTNEICEDAPIE